MVRLATAADRPAIVRLQSHLASPSPALVDLVGTDAALAVLDEPAADERTMLDAADAAATDERPQGAATRAVGYALAISGDPAELCELAVAPGWRRQGRGRALCAGLCSRLGREGTAAITSLAAADDDRARGFHESVGFEAVGRVPDHFGPGLDAVRYRRSLSG